MTTTTRPRPAGAADPTRPDRQVDPRLEARRERVARQEDLRRLWAVAVVAVVSSAAVLAIAAANSGLLDVERIDVVGATEADPAGITTAVGIEPGEPLLEVDLEEAAAAVEDVPWVEHAVVRRSWRGTVTIAVEERVALAALPSPGGHTLVDGTGRQLEEQADPPAGFLPVTGAQVSGIPGDEVSPEGRMAVDLLLALPPGLATEVSGISVTDGGLTMDLAAGGRVEIGDDRQLDDKLVALGTVLARVDLTCLEYIRVEVPSHPTIKREGAPEGAAVEGQEPEENGGGC